MKVRRQGERNREKYDRKRDLEEEAVPHVEAWCRRR
jgi:hypothetical protein